MIEKIEGRERVHAVPARAEQFLAILEEGGVIEAEDVVPAERIATTFDYLTEIHQWIDDENILDVPPEELATAMRRVKKLCNELEEPIRALNLACAVTELATMELSPQHLRASSFYAESRYWLNERTPAERNTPEDHHEAVCLLGVATRKANAAFSGSFGNGVYEAMSAATAMGNSLYGKELQQVLLGLIAESDVSEETLFNAYLTVTSKARLSYEPDPAQSRSSVLSAVNAMDEKKGGDRKPKFRLGNHLRGMNDTLGAAVLLRQKLPAMRPEEYVAALLANAPVIGSLSQRLTLANPLDHDGMTMSNDHNVARVASVVANYNYDINFEDGLPKLTIPEGAFGEDEFPDFIFSGNPEVRLQQEQRISRQRMKSGRCPVRHPIRLPEGETKTRIEQYDAQIKALYGVDPGILVNGVINPAALMIARVIEMGVNLGDRDDNIWTFAGRTSSPFVLGRQHVAV